MNNNPVACSRYASEQPNGLAISSITEAELWFGVENSANYDKHVNKLRHFLTTVDVLPFDSHAAFKYGNVRTKLKRAGTPIGDRNTLIAAHAKSLGLTLVTDNTREFRRVEGLAVEDWMG